jgi:hypothetical protein
MAASRNELVPPPAREPQQERMLKALASMKSQPTKAMTQAKGCIELALCVTDEVSAALVGKLGAGKLFMIIMCILFPYLIPCLSRFAISSGGAVGHEKTPHLGHGAGEGVPRHHQHVAYRFEQYPRRSHG